MGVMGGYIIQMITASERRLVRVGVRFATVVMHMIAGFIVIVPGHIAHLAARVRMDPYVQQ